MIRGPVFRNRPADPGDVHVVLERDVFVRDVPPPNSASHTGRHRHAIRERARVRGGLDLPHHDPADRSDQRQLVNVIVVEGVPLGILGKLEAKGIKIGTPSLGGSITTAGDLVFTGATVFAEHMGVWLLWRWNRSLILESQQGARWTVRFSKSMMCPGFFTLAPVIGPVPRPL